MFYLYVIHSCLLIDSLMKLSKSLSFVFIKIHYTCTTIATNHLLVIVSRDGILLRMPDLGRDGIPLRMPDSQ